MEELYNIKINFSMFKFQDIISFHINSRVVHEKIWTTAICLPGLAQLTLTQNQF